MGSTYMRVVSSNFLAGRRVKTLIAAQESAHVVQRRKFVLMKSVP